MYTYIKQQGSTFITYARVIGELKNGGLRVIAVTICDGHTGRAAIQSTRGWNPAPMEINGADMPIKILAKMDKHQARVAA